jgi:hypothetical protein
VPLAQQLVLILLKNVFADDVFDYFQWLQGGVPNTNAAKNPLGLLHQRDNNSTVNSFHRQSAAGL